jgi:hypothetical protein
MGTAGDKVLETIIRKALDDEDKDQIAALKMCLDRILPQSVFDGKKAVGAVPTISINISGLNEPEVVATQLDSEEVEFTEYDNDQ